MIAALLIPIAVLVAAFFSLSEMAIIATGRLRLRHWVQETMERGGWPGPAALERPYRLLSPILVGHTLTVTAAAMLTADVLAAGPPRPQLAVAALATAALVPPLYLFGEVVPRIVARSRGAQLFQPVVWLLRGAALLFGPLVAAADAATGAILRAVGAAGETGPAFGRRSLEMLLLESERVGIVEPAEREIIAGVFEFGQTPVEAVMTPVERMITAEAGATAAEISALIQRHGYSRIPLRGRGSDRIVGMVHAFDLLKLPPDGRPLTRSVAFATRATLCDELLIEMKRRRSHLTVVAEDGRTFGMVTLEDLVEELVGEIRDEHDAREIGFDPRSFVVDGSARIVEIRGRYGIELPSDGAETVAEFLLARHGRIPRTGEEIVFGDWTIDVLDASPESRVQRVRFRRRPPLANP